jgi:hypothetical protein
MLSIHFDTDKRMVCFCKLKALCLKILSLSLDLYNEKIRIIFPFMQCCESGSGIRNRFFPDPGSRIPDPKPIFYVFVIILGVNFTNFTQFYLIFGLKKWFENSMLLLFLGPGSGINIPDPQHLFHVARYNLFLYVFSSGFNSTWNAGLPRNATLYTVLIR